MAEINSRDWNCSVKIDYMASVELI